MNQHVSGATNGAIIYKDHVSAREPETPQKGQRKPLGLAPAGKDVSSPSALDGRSTDELASPATIGNVLEALDAAIAIRSDLDAPLHVQLSHLESSNGDLRSEVEAAKSEIATLRTSLAKAESATSALRASVADQARKAAAAAKAAKEAKLARVLARAEQKVAQP